jgi:hypothetical protein
MKLISYVAVNQHYRWSLQTQKTQAGVGGAAEKSGGSGDGGSSFDGDRRPESTGSVQWDGELDIKPRTESPAVK